MIYCIQRTQKWFKFSTQLANCKLFSEDINGYGLHLLQIDRNNMRTQESIPLSKERPTLSDHKYLVYYQT